ncbi:hypothetical protein GobsT_07100 [Gemmata obscuriglobus]|uniref:Uncharacterized protein n=1 Tax=Gemmata obscuriglobus TaxID=114 RepID=A0A2Z3HH80_9BACT|nr:hypothetical protein [Gemmata obscuriglobus]AWM40750.1 hypothetical protein C1280_29700 [Gemmata obscuriglobus]QEG25975.1 hypothetical protein GobsT_07100 [Gemmata obscuriglobus]VTS00206.1 unnamed protein product [Gemmata obscuriglobus UQM 2246]
MTEYEKLSLQLLSQILAGISVSIQLHQQTDECNIQKYEIISEFYDSQIALLTKVNDTIKRNAPAAAVKSCV